MKLASISSEAWLSTVLSDFDTFLVDHAACEKKASAYALSLMSHYPDKKELASAMVELACEELEHFKQVYALIEKRGLTLGSDRKDEYVRKLNALSRQNNATYLLDRLLIAGVIEPRGCERFALIGKHIEDPELSALYTELARAEARHAGGFVRLARQYYSLDTTQPRLEELLIAEAAILEALPLQPVLH